MLNRASGLVLVLVHLPLLVFVFLTGFHVHGHLARLLALQLGLYGSGQFIGVSEQHRKLPALFIG